MEEAQDRVQGWAYILETSTLRIQLQETSEVGDYSVPGGQSECSSWWLKYYADGNRTREFLNRRPRKPRNEGCPHRCQSWKVRPLLRFPEPVSCAAGRNLATPAVCNFTATTENLLSPRG